MFIRIRPLYFTFLSLFIFISCSETAKDEQDIIKDQYLKEQQEVMDVVNTIVEDAESANLEGLSSIHLDSDKFTKFGPRNFERQNVTQTNNSEVAFFGDDSVTNYKEEVSDLKVDVFGDVAIATYYRSVSYLLNNEEKNASLRQTLVFVKTKDRWKIAHEHGTRL